MSGRHRNSVATKAMGATFSRGPISASGRRIHWPNTLMQKGKASLQSQHLRYQSPRPPSKQLYCLLLDCSASMLKQQKLSLAKGLIVAMSEQIYCQRGELALIGFRGNEAQVLKKPGKLGCSNSQWIKAIQGGGGTPITQGTQVVEKLLKQYRRQFPGMNVVCWLLTDGRFSALPEAPRGAQQYTVVDFEQDRVHLARAQQIAQLWQAEYVLARDLK